MIRKANQTIKAEVASRTNELEVITKTLHDLYRNFSHEFRTPVTILAGNIERLGKTLTLSQYTPVLKTLRKNCHQLRNLVERINDIAKIKDVVNDSYVEPNSIIRQIVSYFDNELEKDEKSIVLALESKQMISISVDGFELIIRNLLSNAIKIHTKRSDQIVNER